MSEFKTMDGNEACAHIAYMFTEVAGIYPITPASPMAEHIDEWSNEGRTNLFNDRVKVVEMQSEAGAAGMVHGSLQAGALTSTFTASQGLLLMLPNMYKIAGELLPGVMHVASRSLATHALSIFGDHQDIYATRPTGFAILANSGVQQVMDLSAVAHLSAIHGSVPFLNFFDGFRTSHEMQKIEVLEKEDLAPLIDKDKLKEFKKKGLSPVNRVTRGTAQNEDIYFQATEVRNMYYNELPDTVNFYMKRISKLTNRDYKPFNYYGDKKAKRIIVAMGSVCETIKETIDEMNRDGEKVGLIEVHLYRPFSDKYFFNVFPNSVEKIAVLDRTKEAGSNGEPLYLDVVNLFKDKNYKPNIIGGRYGLSSKDTNPSHIKGVFDFLDKHNNFSGFTVGIEDDITKLSIKKSKIEVNNSLLEIMIYGYGSDGMVSASKDIMKVIGNHTSNYVQGYFQYDSKKSGGLTRSHLRLSDKPIRATYFIERPDFVVSTKESYLEKYDMLSNIKENGVFLAITRSNKEEFLKKMPDDVKRVLKIKNIKVFTLNAYKIAEENNLQNKISMIVERSILKIINLIEKNMLEEILKENIKNNFSKKGEELVNKNIKAIEDSVKELKQIELDDKYNNDRKEVPIFNDKIFNMINNLKGNELKVSDFIEHHDGTYISGTAKYEKRGIAENVPVWDSEKCIQCNQCSIVCPHAAIRPFLLNEKELKYAPNAIKNNIKKYPGTDYYFYIGISDFDCTGCGLCANTCPTNALEMLAFDHDDHEYSYLTTTVQEKKEMIKPTIKNSQFKAPMFECSGACAGCGETPYLKLLTQLFGESMVVANATGCSSIYGGSMPSTPWSVPWANSLFEDNAEFGFGMLVATNTMREKIKRLMETAIDQEEEETKVEFKKWLKDPFDPKATLEVYHALDYRKAPYLRDIKDYIPARTIWAIGGDGWAYDIGFSGIDHILASGENINILVLDTEVYSNTGGQSSKASERASLAKFTSDGKTTAKKDLARMAMSYKNAYVAQISLGANMQQAINAFVEANKHDGPSLIIAYSPCINHGIKGGMGNSISEEKQAVTSGYFPIFRYNPNKKEFNLDYKKPNFDTFEAFLGNERRFSMQKDHQLLKQAKEDAIERFQYYKELDEKNNS